MALPPGPRRPAVLQGIAWLRRPLDFLDRCRARHGGLFTLRFPGGRRLVIVADPELVREVFAAPPAVFKAGFGSSFEPLLGAQSLLVVSGPRHARHRRLLGPPFVGKRMRAYGAPILEIAARAIASLPAGRPFSAFQLFDRVAQHVIFRVVFGVHDEARCARLEDLVNRVRRFLVLVFYLPWLHWDLGPLSPWGRWLRLRRDLDAFLYEEIARAQAEAGSGREDILAKLVEARDDDGSPLSDEEVRDELVTLLLAGHETTAASLAWATRWILADPELERKAAAEVREVAGDRPLDAEHLPRLRYLEACCLEVLRIVPILAVAPRVLAQPFRLGGHDLEPGVFVSPCMWLVHRDPAVFPRPERFEPERFLDESARPPPHCFFPFGGGYRLCIGHAFAIYEMKAVLAAFLAGASLELAPGAPPALAHDRKGILALPRGGPPVVLRARRGPVLAAGEAQVTGKP